VKERGSVVGRARVVARSRPVARCHQSSSPHILTKKGAESAATTSAVHARGSGRGRESFPSASTGVIRERLPSFRARLRGEGAPRPTAVGQFGMQTPSSLHALPVGHPAGGQKNVHRMSPPPVTHECHAAHAFGAGARVFRARPLSKVCKCPGPEGVGTWGRSGTSSRKTPKAHRRTCLRRRTCDSNTTNRPLVSARVVMRPVRSTSRAPFRPSSVHWQTRTSRRRDTVPPRSHMPDRGSSEPGQRTPSVRPGGPGPYKHN
jgi:hypothetical protein